MNFRSVGCGVDVHRTFFPPARDRELACFMVMITRLHNYVVCAGFVPETCLALSVSYLPYGMAAIPAEALDTGEQQKQMEEIVICVSGKAWNCCVM